MEVGQDDDSWWTPTTMRRSVEAELRLTYRFVKSNLDAAFLPVPLFTMASMFCREMRVAEVPLIMAREQQLKPPFYCLTSKRIASDMEL